MEWLNQNTLDPAHGVDEDNTNHIDESSPPVAKKSKPSRDCTEKRLTELNGIIHVDAESVEEKSVTIVTGSSETEPYSVEDYAEYLEDKEVINVDSAPADDGPGTSHSHKSNLRRVASVSKDAENIAAMLGVEDVDIIYKRVLQLRNRGNRTDLVTNEILENGMDALQEKVKTVQRNQKNDDLFSDLEQICSAVKEVYPKAVVNPNEIYVILERHADRKGRVDFVRDLVLKDMMKKEITVIDDEELPVIEHHEDPLEILSEEHQLLSDLEVAAKRFPNINANHIFELIIKHEASENRIDKVQEILQQETDELAQKNNEADLTEDPLYKEMMQISAMFPHRDKNEIYAYLEAHYHEKNRVQVVINELLQLEKGSQEDSQSQKGGSGQAQGGEDDKKPVNGKNGLTYQQIRGSWNRKRSKNAKIGTMSKKNKLTPEEEIQQEVDLLLNVFPEYEPQDLFEKLSAIAGHSDRLQKVLEELFVESGPSKQAEGGGGSAEGGEQRENSQSTGRSQEEQDIDNFLKKYPNSRTDSQKMKQDTVTPKHEGDRQSSRTCRTGSSPVTKQRNADKSSDDPVSRENLNNRTTSPRKSNKPNRTSPAARDVSEKNIINRDLSQRAGRKRPHAMVPPSPRAILSCESCRTSDLPMDQMVQCPLGHTVCTQCVRNAAAKMISITKLKCIHDNCKLYYDIRILQAVLPNDQQSLLSQHPGGGDSGRDLNFERRWECIANLGEVLKQARARVEHEGDGDTEPKKQDGESQTDPDDYPAQRQSLLQRFIGFIPQMFKAKSKQEGESTEKDV